MGAVSAEECPIPRQPRQRLARYDEIRARYAAGLIGLRGDDEQMWREIPGRAGYEVSVHGDVRSWRNSSRFWTKIHPQPDRDGYLRISGVGWRMLVHHAVLGAFVGPRPAGMEGAHLNNRRDDNRLDNLAWTTHLDNIRQKFAHGTMVRGERCAAAKLVEADVREIRALWAGGTPTRVLAARYDIRQDHVWRIVSGRSWRHVEAA